MFINLVGFLLFSDMTSERFDLINADKCDSVEFGKRFGNCVQPMDFMGSFFFFF